VGRLLVHEVHCSLDVNSVQLCISGFVIFGGVREDNGLPFDPIVSVSPNSVRLIDAALT
jgi:hypothetical protein